MYLDLPERSSMTSKQLWAIAIGSLVTILLGVGAFLFNTLWGGVQEIPLIKYQVQDISQKVNRIDTTLQRGEVKASKEQ
jgi:hypothetical protein